MPVRRLMFLLAPPLILVVVCAVLSGRLITGFSASLDELVDGTGRLIPSSLRSRSLGTVPVIVSSSDPAKAHATADALFAAFQKVSSGGRTVASYCFDIRYRSDGGEINRLSAFYRTHRAGLVAPSVAEKLKTPEGRASVARAAARRYYSSPVPPLFGPEEDPFCLLDGFVTSLPASFSGWFPKDGVLTAERDGETHLLMLLELKDWVPREPDKLVDFKRVLDAAIASVPVPDACRISACGAPLHTAISVANCRREIGWLSWFSLVFIAALAVVAFRSVKWIPLLALSLVTSVLAGFAALLALFVGFHMMTAVMGTTVLGLVIDYSFHWLLHGEDDRRETVRNLLVSCVTTEISLVPLMLSSIPVLRQSSVFLGAGLAAAFGYVVCCYPRTACAIRMDRAGGRFGWARCVSLLVALAAVGGLFSVRFGTEMTAVYRPPEELSEPERLFAELNGGADGKRGFVESRGEDFELLLETEDSLGLPLDVPRLSRFLPPLKSRHAVAADVARLYSEQGERQAKLLGVASPVPPSAPVSWTPDDLPQELRKGFVLSIGPQGRERQTHILMIPSAPEPDRELPDGVTFCRPRETIARVLSGWADETLVRLGIALVLMFAALAVLCRGRAPVVFVPSVFALVSVAGLLGLLGTKVNLFHLLAAFLLAGMSVDYTVFLHSGKSLKPALCSLLTSMAGFGALVFVSFPVVRSFGFVLGLGLPIAFVAAFATMPSRPREGVEKGASPLGLEFLFWIYRLFGLRALHACAEVVGLCVWTGSSGVRRASPSLRKTLNFTRSLADKLVIMAEGRTLPKVETDGSADAAAFLADVRGGRGVFVLSSHCGTVEALVALGKSDVTFHAWMDIGRTSVFNRFYLRHARRRRVVIHPISEVGMETAFFAGDALDRGDSLVMAGDRGRGAFRFAHALGAPVYFIACVWAGDRYRTIIRRLPVETKDMERAYGAALTEVAAAWPDQWFEWEKAEEGKE